MLGERVKVPCGHCKFQVSRKFNFVAEVHLVEEKINHIGVWLKVVEILRKMQRITRRYHIRGKIIVK